MIMRLRYIGTELIDFIPFGKIYYVRFKQHKDLTISIHASNGEGLSYTDLYHFLTEWKILNIERGREYERYTKSNRSNGFGTGNGSTIHGHSITGAIVCYDYNNQTTGRNGFIH